MPEALYPLAVLACPVGMGLMMWMMMRRDKPDQAPQPRRDDADLNELRREVEELRAQQQGRNPTA